MITTTFYPSRTLLKYKKHKKIARTTNRRMLTKNFYIRLKCAERWRRTGKPTAASHLLAVTVCRSHHRVPGSGHSGRCRGASGRSCVGRIIGHGLVGLIVITVGIVITGRCLVIVAWDVNSYISVGAGRWLGCVLLRLLVVLLRLLMVLWLLLVILWLLVMIVSIVHVAVSVVVVSVIVVHVAISVVLLVTVVVVVVSIVHWMHHVVIVGIVLTSFQFHMFLQVSCIRSRKAQRDAKCEEDGTAGHCEAKRVL